MVNKIVKLVCVLFFVQFFNLQAVLGQFNGEPKALYKIEAKAFHGKLLNEIEEYQKEGYEIEKQDSANEPLWFVLVDPIEQNRIVLFRTPSNIPVSYISASWQNNVDSMEVTPRVKLYKKEQLSQMDYLYGEVNFPWNNIISKYTVLVWVDKLIDTPLQKVRVLRVAIKEKQE